MGVLCGIDIDSRDPNFGALLDDPSIIAQWVELCLMTANGSDWIAPEYGLDLRQYILKGMSDDDLAVLPTTIEHALSVNQQIASSSVAIAKTFTGGGGVALALTITITPKTPADGPFTLVGTASADLVSIMLQGLTPDGSA